MTVINYYCNNTRVL